MQFKRIFLIVMDSVGIGEAADARKFGDVGAHTLKHILEFNKMELPYLNWLGLGNILGEKNKTAGYYGKLAEISNGKDTLTGHLEMMGIRTKVPFKTFPDGFPTSLLREIEKQTGRGIIGNRAESGTEIIKQLGEEHMKTGHIIVYTSADSVYKLLLMKK